MPVKPRIDPESFTMNQVRMSSREVSRKFIQSIGIGLFLMVLWTRYSEGAPAEKASGVTNSELSGGSVLELSLKQAVDLALAPEGNVRVQLAEELVRQAQARSAQSRAALLPNIESFASEQNRTINLAAFGIQIVIPIPGYVSPELVGPFSTFDARVTATQTIFDLSSIRQFQASRTNVRSTKTESESTQDQVASQVAKAYLAALRAQARLESSQANVDLAESLLKLATNQKEAGTGTGIEVTRARVQLANERQRLLVDTTEQREAQLRLLKAIGLKLDGAVKLTDTLNSAPVEPLATEQALAKALEARADYRAQQQREESASLNYSAAKWERLPSLVGFGDYGSIGYSINNAIPTRTYGVELKVPVFDGGRRDAHRAEGASQLRQEQIKTRDLRERIELEVRLALDRLHSAQQQVTVAEEGLDLAQAEMAQAQRRYTSGVTNGIEVTDAQTRLERARDNQIFALFSHSVARIELGEAMGTVRHLIQ